MKDLCDNMGIDHRATSSYHPQSNAQAETYNKTKKYALASVERTYCAAAKEQARKGLRSLRRRSHFSSLRIYSIHLYCIPVCMFVFEGWRESACI